MAAAYIRSLKSFSSRVDRYFGGDHRVLAPAEIRGFNLFMGKAKRGTCHGIRKCVDGSGLS